MECAYYFVDGTWNVPTTLRFQVDGTWNVPTTLTVVGCVAQGNGRSGLHFVAEHRRRSVEDPQATRLICW
jgi:hypothetical protein